MFFFALDISAQTSIQKCRWIKGQSQTFILDSNSVLPATIKLDDAHSSLPFRFDEMTNSIIFETALLATDSFFVCFRALKLNITKPYFKRSIKLLDSTNYYSDNTYRYKNYAIREQREELFPTKNFSKSGSISRGFSVGNNQNVFVNSALNLQLEGSVTPDVKMTAVITDQNVPVQPDGNTQNIQQFDKVYIQFEHEKGKLTAGDYIMKNKDGYFLKYFRNVQGGQLDLNYKIDEHSQANTYAGIALAKGKFNTILFIGTGLTPVANSQPLSEGVLGPYRLLGQNNERSIVLVANSEKIFLDGKQLTRGFNNDYTINYNSAEVTFTSRVMITKYSQLRIDFEYFDRSYPRTSLQAGHNQRYKHMNFGVNFYQQKDNQNQPVNLNLTTEDKLRLSLIGDTLYRAVISGGDSVGYISGQVSYRLVKDSLGYPNIYIYSVDPAKAFYQVSFSDVGQGNGDYIIDPSAINGRVYSWVPPAAGVRQGRYAPVRLINTPQKKSMVTANASIDIDKQNTMYVEGALSQNNLNLYSDVDSYDNEGKALKAGYINKGTPMAKLLGYNIVATFDYEYNQKYFVPIERFRDANFDWDWGISTSTPGIQNAFTGNDSTRADDHIFNASAGLIKNANNQFNYKITRRDKALNAQGWQHRVNFNKSLGKFVIKNDFFMMDNHLVKTTSSSYRMASNLSYNGGKFVPGIIYSTDQNKTSRTGRTEGDSIISSLQNNEQYKIYIKTNDSLKTKIYLDGLYRDDLTPLHGDMVHSARTFSSTFNINTRIGSNHDLGFGTIYRSVTNLVKRDSTVPTIEENIQGRFDWNANVLKKHVRSELTVSSASGRQPKREYVYVPVTTGQGNYFWIDNNNDNIQQLSEFYEAQFPDQKQYIKVFVPTSQYVNSYLNILNYRLNISAPRGWRDKKGLYNVVSRFSNTSSWSVERNITDDGIKYRLLPVINDIPPEELLSNTTNLRSTLFFNRTSPVYGLDLSFLKLFQKQFLSNGFESRQNNEIQFNSRVNMGKYFNTKTTLSGADKVTASDYLGNKNYQVFVRTVKPELAFQPTDFVRLTGTYRYTLNKSDQGDKANINEGGLELRWSKVSKRTVQSSVKVVDISYGGLINTPLAYELLEGLSVGKNYIWSVSWQQKLSNGLQVSLIYDGRKSQLNKTVHTGRMQVTALF